MEIRELLLPWMMITIASLCYPITINLDNDPNVFTLSEKQALFSYNVGRLLNYIYKSGYYCTLGEVYRSVEQAALDAKEGKGIKNSLHCKKLAVDLTLFKPGNPKPCGTEAYYAMGQYWKSLDVHNKWGGDFVKNGKAWPDTDHYEMHW
jgi:hypothetical protein